MKYLIAIFYNISISSSSSSFSIISKFAFISFPFLGETTVSSTSSIGNTFKSFFTVSSSMCSSIS